METLCFQDAKRRGERVSVETCPHYLAFSADMIPDGDTRFKCALQNRDAENKEKLWTALLVKLFVFCGPTVATSIILPDLIEIEFQDGDIDMLSSDHSPAVPELKLFNEGNFLRAWGDISSFQVHLFVNYFSAHYFSFMKTMFVSLLQLFTGYCNSFSVVSTKI